MTFTLADGSVVTLSELQVLIIQAEQARKAKVSQLQQPKEEACPQ